MARIAVDSCIDKLLTSISQILDLLLSSSIKREILNLFYLCFQDRTIFNIRNSDGQV